jgi:AcrR family transcriptional regulator
VSVLDSMNRQIESSVADSESADGGKPLGVRAAAKARTRRKLIDAAKQLFMQRGYEGATVRDIASAAGLSTGAVFASFSDKAELFNDVLLCDGDAQAVAMREAAAERGGVRERLVRVLTVGYRFQLNQIQLLRAALAVSWSQGLAGELGDRPIRKIASDTIHQLLRQGVAEGELSANADLGLITETIWDCFVGNYRYALFNGQGLERLTERLRRQIDLIVASAAARGS